MPKPPANKPPAFQFYPDKWLSDQKVTLMSPAGEGNYIRLLCYSWEEGSIPADRSAIVKLCKGIDGPEIDEALSCFVKSKKDGRLINKRLEKERNKLEINRKLKQIAGLDGARKRWQTHSTPIPSAIAKNSSSSSTSSSTPVLTPLPPLRKGGRKYQRKIAGSNSDPAYREAWEKKKAKEGKP